MFIPGTDFLGGLSINWFYGIEPNAFGAVGAIVNFIVAIAVCQFTAKPPQEIYHMVDEFRSPNQ